MKKHLLILFALLLNMSLFSQVFKLASGSSNTFMKKEGTSGWIDITNSMAMNHDMSVRFTLVGKNAGAVVSSDLNSLSSTGDTITFGPNATTRRLSFKTTLDGSVEGNDTFIFKLTTALTMGSIGTPDSVMFIVTDSTAAPITGRTLVDIGKIRGNNKGNSTNSNIDGTPDSVGITCTVRGVLYGINRRAANAGYLMYICDGTGCMGMISNKTYSLYPNAKEGDSVEISGYVEEFRGLGQIKFQSTGDTIRLLGTGIVKSPVLVTKLDETTESKLIKVEDLKIKSGTWLADSNFNILMQNTAGTEFNIRIENKPSTNFSAIESIKVGKTYRITGMGSQFDVSTSPKTSGYQMLPRKMADIEEMATVSVAKNNTDNDIQVFPTQVRDFVYIHIASKAIEKLNLQLIDIQGKVVRNELVSLQTGDNIYKLENINLENGIYMLHINSNSIQYTQTINVIK